MLRPARNPRAPRPRAGSARRWSSTGPNVDPRLNPPRLQCFNDPAMVAAVSGAPPDRAPRVHGTTGPRGLASPHGSEAQGPRSEIDLALLELHGIRAPQDPQFPGRVGGAQGQGAGRGRADRARVLPD